MMKKSGQAMLILLVVVFSVMLVAGCEEEASNERMTKLVANENRQLKKKLKHRNEEFTRQKQLLAGEIKRQKQLLEKCLERKKVLQRRSAKELHQQVQGVFGTVMEQSAKQRQEIEALKKELEECKSGTKPIP